MRRIGMQEGIGDEGPDVGGGAARKRCAADHRRIVTRRDKGKAQQHFDILLLGQRIDAHQMNQDQHRGQRGETAGHIEDRLAPRG